MWNPDSGCELYDHAGNMIDDGTFVYVYDAPALDTALAAKRRCRVATRELCSQ